MVINGSLYEQLCFKILCWKLLFEVQKGFIQLQIYQVTSNIISFIFDVNFFKKGCFVCLLEKRCQVSDS